MKYWQFTILALFAFSTLSFTQSPKANNKVDLASINFAGGYSFKGKVKTISYGTPIKIRFTNLNKGAVNKVETVHVCNLTQYTTNSFILEQQMSALKEAQRRGTVLHISYDNLFDRCLREFEFTES